MRLKKTSEGVTLYSTIPWEDEELAALARKGHKWVCFSSTGTQPRVLGKIHIQSGTIQLEQGVEIQDRQVVVLGPVQSGREEVRMMRAEGDES